jgi:hypothetical protein
MSFLYSSPFIIDFITFWLYHFNIKFFVWKGKMKNIF